MFHSNHLKTGVQKGITSFDIIKCVCSFLILFIHASPLEGVAPTLHFYLSDVISRSSVCVFFAISGYLVFRKMEFCNTKVVLHPENCRILIRQWKRILLVYITWVVIYILFMLPQWYQMNWWGLTLLKDLGTSFFLSGVHYHLWFLLSMLYALPLLFFLMHSLKPTLLLIVASIAWVLQCLTQSYRFLGFFDFPAFLWFEEHFNIIWIAITRALPLLAVGALCVNRKSYRASIYFPLVCFAIYTIEASILNYIFHSHSYAYLLSTPLFAYSMMQFLLTRQWNISAKASMLCRNTSLTIYCMHPLIIETYDLLMLPKGILRFLVPATVTAVFALLWYYISPLLKQYFLSKRKAS